jgi:dihydroorotate dehydrogenase electron transfer subunit
MLRLPEQSAPLLRRPFSIHRLITTGGRTTGIEILYKVVGKGTLQLSGCSPGDIVDVLGPLGNGFTLSDQHRRIAIVAGGIGVAPMLFLALALKKRAVNQHKCTVFLGGRTMDDLLCREDFEQLKLDIHLTTDDGSEGDQCLVTHPLEMAMEQQTADVIYACGPWEMLQCVVGIAEKHSIPCQVSIETIMACGMGACLGCAVAKKGDSSKYMHVCMDGPVFNAEILKI